MREVAVSLAARFSRLKAKNGARYRTFRSSGARGAVGRRKERSAKGGGTPLFPPGSRNFRGEISGATVPGFKEVVCRGHTHTHIHGGGGGVIQLKCSAARAQHNFGAGVPSDTGSLFLDGYKVRPPSFPPVAGGGFNATEKAERFSVLISGRKRERRKYEIIISQFARGITRRNILRASVPGII